ncbi:DUF4231 domain-containing protein [filamentous cyanobacterium CCP5]|nr:DUF4231 domain-containing protein [filamentous cyanobacterium CCP5]
MADSKPSYADILKADFNTLFESLQLQDIQRHFLRSRWLDQVMWMEKKAATCQRRYYRLRITAIVLGVIVPVMVGIDLRRDTLNEIKKYATIGLSTIVAVSAAVEEFFHYGERWNHYRRTVESLKTQGWQFSQLSGPYRDFKNHEAAFGSFAEQIEELLQRDVEVYVTQLATPNKKQQDDEED